MFFASEVDVEFVALSKVEWIGSRVKEVTVSVVDATETTQNISRTHTNRLLNELQSHFDTTFMEIGVARFLGGTTGGFLVAIFKGVELVVDPDVVLEVDVGVDGLFIHGVLISTGCVDFGVV